MIRKILLPFILFLALAAGEAALARWLPTPFHIPLLLPALIALAMHVPIRRLLRLAFLGALAGEIVSGLPQGIFFTALIGITLLARVIIRRPELPIVVHGLIGVGTALLFMIGVQGVGGGFSVPPARLLPEFLAAAILVPVLTTGILVSLMSGGIDVLRRRRARPLGFLPGIIVQRLPSA